MGSHESYISAILGPYWAILGYIKAIYGPYCRTPNSGFWYSYGVGRSTLRWIYFLFPLTGSIRGVLKSGRIRIHIVLRVEGLLVGPLQGFLQGDIGPYEGCITPYSGCKVWGVGLRVKGPLIGLLPLGITWRHKVKRHYLVTVLMRRI